MLAGRIRLVSCTAALALAFALSLASNGAMASAQRTFVASTGNDANAASNCSLSMPCRSFGGALAQTLDGGEIVVLDSAGYATVTIDRSVSIIAPQGVYAGITAFSGDAISITAFNLRVALRGLNINALGGANGINVVVGASDILLERVTISGFALAGIFAEAGALASTRLYVHDAVLRNNNVGIIAGATSSFVDESSAMEVMLDGVRIEENTLDGIELIKGAKLHVRDSVIERNGGNGILADTGSTMDAFMALTVEGSSIRRNAKGIRVVAGQLNVASRVLVTIVAAVVGDNVGAGIDASCLGSSPAAITISDSTISGNGGDGIVGAGAGCALSVSHNLITGNGGTSMVNVSAGSFASFADNRVRGNATDTPSGTVTAVPLR